MNKNFIKLFLLLSIQLSSVFAQDIAQDNNSISLEAAPQKRIRRSRRKTHPHMPGKKETESNNWSGYVVGNFNNPGTQEGSVTQVQASFIVPKILHSPKPTFFSIWVGIDGFNDGTVEQIGIEGEYVNGNVIYDGFVELYPAAPQEIPGGFSLKEGDQIFASVQYGTVGGQTGFNFTLNNVTQNISRSFFKPWTSANPPQLKTAEIIVEAPFSNRVLPLAHFEPVTLSNIGVTINGVSGTLENSGWQNKEIVMGNGRIIKAQPTALTDGNQFSVIWKHK